MLAAKKPPIVLSIVFTIEIQKSAVLVSFKSVMRVSIGPTISMLLLIAREKNCHISSHKIIISPFFIKYLKILLFIKNLDIVLFIKNLDIENINYAFTKIIDLIKYVLVMFIYDII